MSLKWTKTASSVHPDTSPTMYSRTSLIQAAWDQGMSRTYKCP